MHVLPPWWSLKHFRGRASLKILWEFVGGPVESWGGPYSRSRCRTSIRAWEFLCWLHSMEQEGWANRVTKDAHSAPTVPFIIHPFLVVSMDYLQRNCNWNEGKSTSCATHSSKSGTKNGIVAALEKLVAEEEAAAACWMLVQKIVVGRQRQNCHSLQ